jgi:hypothetical protein
LPSIFSDPPPVETQASSSAYSLSKLFQSLSTNFYSRNLGIPPFNVDMSNAGTPAELQRILAEQNEQAQRHLQMAQQFGEPQNTVILTLFIINSCLSHLKCSTRSISSKLLVSQPQMDLK